MEKILNRSDPEDPDPEDPRNRSDPEEPRHRSARESPNGFLLASALAATSSLVKDGWRPSGSLGPRLNPPLRVWCGRGAILGLLGQQEALSGRSNHYWTRSPGCGPGRNCSGGSALRRRRGSGAPPAIFQVVNPVARTLMPGMTLASNFAMTVRRASPRRKATSFAE